MAEKESRDKIIFDGFDLATGRPRTGSVSPVEAGRRILGKRQAGEWEPMPKREKAVRGLPRGWGLVCRPNLDPSVLDALEPLIQKRRGDVYPYNGALDEFSWSKYLEKEHCSLPSSSMYLLLVGSPQEIPFDFEKMLTPQHAVGRLHLPDAAAYERYVRTLLAYEEDEGSTNLRRHRAEFYAPDDTPETRASCREFAQSMMEAVEGIEEEDFEARGWLGSEATRERVLERLQAYGDDGAPALTFLVSHGLEVSGDLRARFQGSWVPQGAPALGHTPSVQEVQRYCLTGDDFVTGDLSPHGSVVFNFSCFGGGLHGEFTLSEWFLEGEVVSDDPHPLVSALGQSLLGNPRPALAYVSTLDRKSNIFSLLPNGLKPFEDWAYFVLNDWSVGQACQILWDKSVTLLQSAHKLLERAIQSGQTVETLPEEKAWSLALNWIMANELDNFVIHGDPAVCLHRL